MQNGEGITNASEYQVEREREIYSTREIVVSSSSNPQESYSTSKTS